MWSSIVSTLAILRDTDSADRALALFDADFIDETMISRRIPGEFHGQTLSVCRPSLRHP